MSKVFCRGVQPDFRPTPVGEHCEEGGSFSSAGHEPAAHKTAVLHGEQLS